MYSKTSSNLPEAPEGMKYINVWCSDCKGKREVFMDSLQMIVCPTCKGTGLDKDSPKLVKE
jgi:ribosomal protein S27E